MKFCLLFVLIASFGAQATLLFPTSNAIRDTNADGIGDEVASFASDYVFHNEFEQSRVYNEFDISFLPLLGVTVETATLRFTVENYQNYSGVPNLSNFLQLRTYESNDNVELDDWSRTSEPLVNTFEVFEYDGPDSFQILEFSFDISDLLKDFIADAKQGVGILALDPVTHSAFDPPGLLRLLDMTISLNDKPTAQPVSEPNLLGLLGLGFLIVVARQRGLKGNTCKQTAPSLLESQAQRCS